MKATRPGTDQELELSVCADNEPLQEYILPRGAAAQDILECFVPVQQGQKLTVTGRFVGTTLSASFDLVVDGSLLAGSSLTDKGAPHYANRKLTFERVYDCPREKQGWTSKTHNPLDVYEANLYTEPLQVSPVNLSELEVEDIRGVRPGIGSIQIVANIQNAVSEHRVDPEWDIEGGGWIHRYKNAVRFSGIRPDYAIEVRHINETPVPQKRSKLHRNHWNVNMRPGFTPWARFIFHYRSSESIDHAGCVPRGTVIHRLEPFTAQHKAALKCSEAGPSDRGESPDARPESETRSVSLPPLPNMGKFSRLGGDFTTQMRPQSEDREPGRDPEMLSGHHTGDVPSDSVTAGEQAGEAQGIRTTSVPPLTPRKHASEREKAAVSSTDNKVHSCQPLHPATQRPEENDSLNKLTSKKQIQAQTSPDNSHASASAATHRTTSSGSLNTSSMSPTSDMVKHAQLISKLPPLAEVIDMIGEEGITQGEAVKIFDDLANEHGFRKPPSIYSKVRAEYNARLERVADLHGGNKYILKDEYLAHIQEHQETPTATSKGEKPPPAPMVPPRPYQGAPSPVVSDCVNKRKRASETPEITTKKIKTEHSTALEARRAELARLKAQTAAILKEAEETKARRAVKKAEKTRLREQREKEQREREQQEQEEMRMLDEELEAQQAAQDAAKAALAVAEDSDTADDDDDDEDDDEVEHHAEMPMIGEGEAESEEE